MKLNSWSCYCFWKRNFWLWVMLKCLDGPKCIQSFKSVKDGNIFSFSSKNFGLSNISSNYSHFSGTFGFIAWMKKFQVLLLFVLWSLRSIFWNFFLKNLAKNIPQQLNFLENILAKILLHHKNCEINQKEPQSQWDLEPSKIHIKPDSSQLHQRNFHEY